MKEIGIPIGAQLELLVHVTDQMEADYRDCAAKAGVIDGDGKGCEECSWWGIDIGCEGICQIPELKELLEGYDVSGQQGQKSND